MKLLNSIALTLSGGLIVTSIFLSKTGFDNSTLSHNAASTMAGIGGGIGVGIFIYFGPGNSDIIGSIVTGLISALVIGISMNFQLSRKK